MQENFSFENNHNDLVYTLPTECKKNSLVLGMMNNNTIEGLLPVEFQEEENKRLATYNISSLISLTDYLQTTLTRTRFLNIFRTIANTYMNMEDYGLEAQNIVFDIDYIFVKEVSEEISMICLPCISPTQTDTVILFQTILKNAHLDNVNEGCGYAEKLSDYLENNTFAMDEFKEFLDTIDIYEAPSIPESSIEEEVIQSELAAEADTTVEYKPDLNDVSTNEISTQNFNDNSSVSPSFFGASDNTSQQPYKNDQSDDNIQQYPNSNTTYPQQDTSNNGNGYPSFFGTSENNSDQQPYQNNQSDDNIQQYPNSNTTYPQQGTSNNGNGYPSFFGASENNSNQQPYQNNPTNDYSQSYVNNGMYSQQGTDSNGYPSLFRTSENNSDQQPYQNNSTNDYSSSYANNGNVGYPPSFETSENNAYQQLYENNNTNIEETTVLTGNTAELSSAAYIIRRKTRDRVTINKPLFHIGKERSYVDYFIADNSAISRRHADIIIKDGKYYIVDTNSTNHVYVNGRLAPVNEEVPLISGSEIILANEVFDFLVM